MPKLLKDTFKQKYGPWVLISGASDGLGAALAHEAASKGLNCALIARREDVLKDLSNALMSEYGVQAQYYVIDLMDENAAARIYAVADEIDVGLYIVNAGGDTVASRFVDADISDWNKLISRNVGLLTETLHNFARRFVKRQRGGLVVVGSDSGFNGAGRISVYSASKGYALNLIESIWAELKPKGVDAVFLAIGATDTAKLRGLMEMRGVKSGEVYLARPHEIAEWALGVIQDGPTQVFDVDSTSMDPLTSPQARRQRVQRNTRIIDFFFGDLKPSRKMLEDLKSGRSWK